MESGWDEDVNDVELTKSKISPYLQVYIGNSTEFPVLITRVNGKVILYWKGKSGLKLPS